MAFQTIGFCCQSDQTLRPGKINRSANFRINLAQPCLSAAAFFLGDPCRDNFKARPPEITHRWVLHMFRKHITADMHKLRQGIIRQIIAGKIFGKLRQSRMHQITAQGRIRRQINRIKRFQPQNPLCINGIGIGHPQINFGCRKPSWPRRQRWTGPRPGDRHRRDVGVQMIKPDMFFLSCINAISKADCSQHNLKPLQPAALNRRGVIFFGGAGDHHLIRA